MVNIGVGNDMVQQAITWANIGPDLCGHLATMNCSGYVSSTLMIAQVGEFDIVRDTDI